MFRAICVIGCFVFPSAVIRAQSDKTTVFFSLDHNRIIVPVEVYFADGHLKTVNAWFDNGSPTLGSVLVGTFRAGRRNIYVGTEAWG